MDSINSLSPLEMDLFEPLRYWDFYKIKHDTLPYSSPYSSSVMLTALCSLMADAALPKSFDVHVGSDGIVKNSMFAAKGDGDASPIVRWPWTGHSATSWKQDIPRIGI